MKKTSPLLFLLALLVPLLSLTAARPQTALHPDEWACPEFREVDLPLPDGLAHLLVSRAPDRTGWTLSLSLPDRPARPLGTLKHFPYSPILLPSPQMRLLFLNEQGHLYSLLPGQAPACLWVPPAPTARLRPEPDGIGFRLQMHTPEGYAWFCSHDGVSEPQQEEVAHDTEPEPPAASARPDLFLAFGDSITWGQLGLDGQSRLGYPGYLSQILNETTCSCTVIRAGVPGETTVEGERRIRRELQRHHPGWVTIHEGTNDLVKVEIPPATTIYNLTRMLDHCREYGARPLLSTLIPRNGWTAIGSSLDRALAINQALRETAAARDIPLADFWALFSSYPEGSGGYLSLMSDHVHPNEKGYQLMAAEWARCTPPPPLSTQAPTLTLLGGAWGEVTWEASTARDVVRYHICFGYSAESLRRQVSTDTNQLRLMHRSLDRWPADQPIHLRIQAEDADGNSTPWTQVHALSPQTSGSRP